MLKPVLVLAPAPPRSYTLVMDPLEQDVGRILSSLGPLPASPPRPALVVLCGLPGSGKSTVTRALCARVDVAVLQSDRVRKLLIPAPTYTSEESARVFAAIHEAIERLLRLGIPTLLDATNLEERRRQPLADIAERAGARLALVWVEASDAEIRRRLTARAAGVRDRHDVSDAGVEVYELLRERVEPIRGDHITINTEQDITPAVETLVHFIEGTDTFAMLAGAMRDER